MNGDHPGREDHRTYSNKLLNRLYRQHKSKLQSRLASLFPELDIADLLGKTAQGRVHRGSGLFFLLPRIAGRLLDNDPDKVLSRWSIRLRQGIVHDIILAFGGNFLGGKRQVIERQEPLPEGRPLIFTPNHGFVHDVITTVLVAEKHAYIVFGTLPHFFNTSYGVAAYANGSILINRKDKASKQALVEKAVRALELGTNIILYPEGAWNKTPNRLLLRYWRGVLRIARRANALIVPVVHLPQTDVIYSSRLAPFDPLLYTEEQDDETLYTLRDIMATELMELMYKYAQSSRAEILGGHRTMHEACEAIIREQVETAGRFYDWEIETGGRADLRPSETTHPGDVWLPIAELAPTPQNAALVLHARQLVQEDYQKRF